MARTDTGTRGGQPHIQLFAQDESAPVRWRLLSGNNRELGRGTDEFEDRESCCLTIKQLQIATAALEHTVQRTSSSTWVWLVALEGQVVAASGHRYDRLIRCRQGLMHFVAQLASCEIGTGLMLTQSRRWSAVSTRTVTESRMTNTFGGIR